MGALWADGVGVRQVLFGGTAQGAQPAARPAARAARPEPSRSRGADARPITQQVQSFRRWVETTAVLGSAAAASLAVAAPFHVEPLAAVSALTGVGALYAGAGALRRGLSLKRLGVRIRDALQGTWRQALGAANPSLAARALAEEVATLAAPEVLNGQYGPAVRRAAEDRAAVLEVLHKLPPADRAVVPDVAPTVNALVERVRLLAAALQRLDTDVSPAMVAALDARIAEGRREQAAATGGTDLGAADRERRLTLLERQRETLNELLQRRAALHGQLESAGLALQNLRLDLVKLRSSGLGSSLTDLAHATQEARALSRDIGHLLDAAAEVRSM
jgi:hypothetical protein